jgi:hypothetical protein
MRRRRNFRRSSKGRPPKTPFRLETWPSGLNTRVSRLARSWNYDRAKGALILQALKRGATYAQAARVTQTVLELRAAKSGISGAERLTRTSMSIVRRWRRRFLAEMAASPHDMEMVVTALWPPDDRDRRERRARARRLLRNRGSTTRSVAKAVGLSQSTIARLKVALAGRHARS